MPCRLPTDSVLPRRLPSSQTFIAFWTLHRFLFLCFSKSASILAASQHFPCTRRGRSVSHFPTGQSLLPFLYVSHESLLRFLMFLVEPDFLALSPRCSAGKSLTPTLGQQYQRFFFFSSKMSHFFSILKDLVSHFWNMSHCWSGIKPTLFPRLNSSSSIFLSSSSVFCALCFLATFQPHFHALTPVWSSFASLRFDSWSAQRACIFIILSRAGGAVGSTYLRWQSLLWMKLRFDSWSVLVW